MILGKHYISFEYTLIKIPLYFPLEFTEASHILLFFKHVTLASSPSAFFFFPCLKCVIKCLPLRQVAFRSCECVIQALDTCLVPVGDQEFHNYFVLYDCAIKYCTRNVTALFSTEVATSCFYQHFIKLHGIILY